MARLGEVRHGTARQGRQGLDCSGLVQFGKSRLVKVWYGRQGVLCKAMRGAAWRGPVRHGELRAGMAGTVWKVGLGLLC